MRTVGHKTFLLLDINPLNRTLHLALRPLPNLSHSTPLSSCLSSPPTGASWGTLPTVWPNPRPIVSFVFPPRREMSFLRHEWSLCIRRLP